MGLGEKLSNILPTRVSDMMRRRVKAPLDDDDAESSETLANRMGLIAPDGKRKVKWDWFVLVLVFYTALVTPFTLVFKDITAHDVFVPGFVFDTLVKIGRASCRERV